MSRSPNPQRAVAAVTDAGRGARLVLPAVRQGLVEFYRSNNLTFASSIAYYALLSMFPFLLLVLALLGLVPVAGTDNTLLQLIATAVPGNPEFLVRQVHALVDLRWQISIIGFLLALWGSMGIFGAITSAINHAWGVERPPGFWKHKLIALTMLAAAAVLLVVTLLLVWSVEIAQSRWFAGVVARVPWLDTLRGVVARNAPTPMFMVVIGLIYYYVPNAQVRLRDVWWGAIVAGLLWRAAFDLFSWYIRDLSRFTVLGQVAAVALFLVWIYLSAVIFLYGAEVSAAYSRLNGAGMMDRHGKPTRR